MIARAQRNALAGRAGGTHALLAFALSFGLVAPRASAEGAGEGSAGQMPTPPPAPGMAAVKSTVVGAVSDAVKNVSAGVPGVAGASAGAAVAPVAALPAAKPLDPAAQAQRLSLLRRKVLRDEDFVENDESNRDPFRSYLRLFVEKTTQKVRQVPAIFEKFALEELALIAIVSGDATPRAMFRDPGGLGQVVKKGDYVSKSAARVTKILSDRVILEQTEVTAAGESRAAEKAVLVNPEAAQQ